MEVIKLKNISKVYVNKKQFNNALKDISLDINYGDIVGLVGPNGAGKSTLIKTICGILHPSSGEVKVFDKDPFKNRKSICYDVGIMFGQRSSLWYNIPVRESLYLMKDIYNISKDIFNERLSKYSIELGVKDLLDIPVRKLSFGQRIKCELLSVILHNPRLIILDEPTIGLDIVAKQSLRNFLQELAKTYKTTILITSHDIQDIQKLCNRVVFINKGTLTLDLDKDKLENILKSTVTLIVEKTNDSSILLDSQFYKGNDDEGLKFILPCNEVNSFITEKILKINKDIKFKTLTPSLEDILYEYYD